MLTEYAKLTEGATAFGPILLQQWQQWQTNKAKEKQEERDYQAKIRQEDLTRQEQLRREDQERQQKARQEDLERRMRYTEDENARLRSENARQPVSLLEVLLRAL